MRLLLGAALAGSFALGFTGTAFAAPSAQRVVVASLSSSAASAISITNFTHKSKYTKAELAESARRQTAYKTFFTKKYGYNATPDQVRAWYEKSYGVAPI